MRFVLDTAVIIAALRSQSGASRLLLLGALRKELTTLASVPLMIEYHAVATRPKHLHMCGLNAGEVELLIDNLAAVVEPVTLSFLWRPATNDPNDDMVLETAVNGRADAIVTFNKRDFLPAARHFGVQILLPREALAAWGQTS